MTQNAMDFSLRGLLAAAIFTLQKPREAAQRVLAEDIAIGTIWLMLATVVAVSVVMGQGSVILTTEGALANPYIANPLLMYAIQMGLLTVMTYATHHIGRFMGGTGEFEDALTLVTWLQFVLVCLQVVQTVAMFLAPPVADLIGIAGLLLFLWLFTNFVAVLHGFQSLGLVFVMILLSAFGVTFVISLILTMIGVTAPGGLDV